MVGRSLSHYKIEAELGRGGMGIVYRAEDTKLDRTVAIKVLPSAALASEDDRARFYREAKAAAQLHHPHIAGVFEIDEAVPSDAPHGTQPSPFIAMEYIEGKTLDAKIKEGPLKLSDAVRITREIASALEAAHEKGIIHRDIKAANIMLTSKGSAKVLDFGLAQTAQSTKLTRMGSTLGTVAYMSPEQARGEVVDLRTDLWSLGAVFYEMVAGRSPFPGDYEQAVVYEILNQDPEPLTAVRSGVPMDLEAVVNKCLAKNQELRYPSAAGLIVDLKRIEESSGVRTTRVTSQTMAAAAPVQESIVKRAWIPTAIAGVVILIAGLLLGKVLFVDDPPARPVVKSHLNLTGAVSPLDAAITPDDKALYFVATDTASVIAQLARYDFETGEQKLIPKTEGALHPTASHDGRWIAFINNNSGQWWKISTAGGDPTMIPGAVSLLNIATATYSIEGDFVYPDTSWSLVSIDQRGVSKVVAFRNIEAGDPTFNYPAASPSGNFLSWRSRREDQVWIPRILRTGQAEPEIKNESPWIRLITNSGHAIGSRGTFDDPGQPVVVPIDLDSGEFVGEEAALGFWSLAVSPSGLLVYEEITEREVIPPSELYRITLSGSVEKMFTLPGSASNYFTVSGDGSMLAISASPDGGRFTDMYVVDIRTEIAKRLSTGGWYEIPTWGPADEYLYFDYSEPSSGGAVWSITRRRADGSGTNESILPDTLNGGDPDMTPDGRTLVYRDFDNPDIWGYDMATDSAFAIVVDDVLQVKPAVAPDGRYVVYAQQGNQFCGSIQVSAVHGASEPLEIAPSGCLPVWTHDGAYIYYQSNETVSRVRVTTEPVFNVLGEAEIMYSAQINRPVGQLGALYFDVAADGTLYVAHAAPRSFESKPHWLVHNWFEELNRIAPRSE